MSKKEKYSSMREKEKTAPLRTIVQIHAKRIYSAFFTLLCIIWLTANGYATVLSPKDSTAQRTIQNFEIAELRGLDVLNERIRPHERTHYRISNSKLFV